MNLVIFYSVLFLLSILGGFCYGKQQEKEEDQQPLSTIAKEMNTMAAEGGKERQGKFFPVFEVVKFANVQCIGNNNRNGTCFTAAECTARAGKNGGTCANGYGICCTFDATCGQTSSNNCTYFVSPATLNPGVCQVTICPVCPNICQLRLDFNQFVISGPSTNTNQIGLALFNNLAATGRPVSNAGQCLTDTFSVTNPGGSSPPVICGTNTGAHMYVDSSDECNQLTFQFGAAGVGTTLPTRAWNIRICQYSCDYNNLAPPGCTQYFYGSNTGLVQTYNYQSGNGQQLANQDQVICVRRERGNCRICFSQTKTADFSVSGPGQKKIIGKDNPAICCAYGSSGKAVGGFDCLSIPLAQKKTAAATLSKRLIGSRFCGQRLTTVLTGTATALVTICSTDLPFTIRGVTDSYENLIEVTGLPLNRGFNLLYTMDSSLCPASTIG